MKKIKKDTLIKVFMIFIGAFSFLLIGVYALFKNFLLELISKNSLHSQQILSDFNLVWIQFFILALLVFSLAFYFLKKLNTKLTDDIKEIKNYVTEISEHKNYEAIIKIKNYTEFLEISLILKNIVKRLKQKDKKS